MRIERDVFNGLGALSQRSMTTKEVFDEMMGNPMKQLDDLTNVEVSGNEITDLTATDGQALILNKKNFHLDSFAQDYIIRVANP